jgi:DNA mismatch repair protein MutS
VPAAEARIDLVDRIFTRIGASDDFVARAIHVHGRDDRDGEHSEQRHGAQPHRAGRNRARHEHVRRPEPRVVGRRISAQCRRRENAFRHALPRADRTGRAAAAIKNFNVAVREWHDQIVFLRKIVEGGTDKSYGIQVARLAGVPKEVLERAKQILSNLEESELTPEGNVRPQTRQRGKLQNLPAPPQMDLFG